MADQNVRVIDLLPGDLVANYGMEAVFISREPHPKYKGLALVHWRLMEGDESHDALSYEQVVGDRKPSSDQQRHARLMAAIGADSRPDEHCINETDGRGPSVHDDDFSWDSI